MRRFAIPLVLLFACDDGGAPSGPLTCQEADLTYGEARQNDLKLRELARCEQDADCTLWQPTLTCDGQVHLRDCRQATHVDNEQAALLRNEEIAGPVCERIPADCTIGVSCPNVTAACVAGLCQAQANSADR